MKIDWLESHQREFLDKNWRLEHQPVMTRLRKERHETLEVERMKSITHPKADPAKAKGALRVIEGQASPDSSAMCSVMEDRNCV